MTRTGAPRVLLAGGGYVGLYTALRLERLLAPGEADLTLVAPESHMTFLPLLPEVASGTLEPRQAVVPLRSALSRTEVVAGHLAGLVHRERRAHIEPRTGQPYDLSYDHVVVGLGSVTRMLPVPGLVETAIGFQTLAEAIHLRNRVLGNLEAAAAAGDADARRRALTFVLVGAGYTGVEVIAELEDMARAACARLPTVSPDELRWVLVEATDRILPTVHEQLSRHALHELRARGIEVRLETTVESCEGGRIELSDGDAFETDTLVWMAGVAPHGLVGELGLATDDQGRLVVDECLQVAGSDGAWGAGDCAAVPDGQGGHHPPTAQHARSEGDHIGRNITHALRGEAPVPFRFTAKGEFITLGNRKGVGEVYGRRLRGFLVWVLRRLYYAVQIPTLDRKVRVLLEWLVGLVFRPDVVSLGSVEQPRRQIEEAADQQRRGAA
jgi:NADH:ubiquinone reductase (H+-translocating)